MNDFETELIKLGAIKLTECNYELKDWFCFPRKNKAINKYTNDVVSLDFLLDCVREIENK